MERLIRAFNADNRLAEHTSSPPLMAIGLRVLCSLTHKIRATYPSYDVTDNNYAACAGSCVCVCVCACVLACVRVQIQIPKENLNTAIKNDENAENDVVITEHRLRESRTRTDSDTSNTEPTCSDQNKAWLNSYW